MRLTSLPALLALTAGCYSVQPLASTTPAPGTRLALTLNDVGRVALGGSMGPEIRNIDGTLMTTDNDAYVLSVRGVDYLNGTYQSWAGEKVRVGRTMVSTMGEKRFSKTRTIAFVAAAAVVGSALAPRALGWGPEARDTTPPPGGTTFRNPRVRIRLTLPH